jgi:hypothetical protein
MNYEEKYYFKGEELEIEYEMKIRFVMVMSPNI